MFPSRPVKSPDHFPEISVVATEKLVTPHRISATVKIFVIINAFTEKSFSAKLMLHENSKKRDFPYTINLINLIVRSDQSKMIDTFQIRQDLGYLELLNAVTFQLLKTKMIRRFLIYVFTISALSAFLGLITTSPQNESPVNYYLKMFAPLLTAPILFLVFTTLIVLILKLFRPNDFHNVSLYFNNSGVQKKGKGIDLITPWKKIIRTEESKNFIFLFVSDLDAHIIQKRFFENYSDLESFREFMFYHLNNS